MYELFEYFVRMLKKEEEKNLIKDWIKLDKVMISRVFEAC